MKKWTLFRGLSQLFFLSLLVYILWSTTYPLKGDISPQVLFKTNPFIMIATSISERVVLPGGAFYITFILITIILGRFFCGWVCPLGSAIDFVSYFNKSKKILKDNLNKRIALPKFIILILIMAASVFGAQIAWIFDPIVIISRFISLNLIPLTSDLINRSFIAIIKGFDLYGPLYEFYNYLRSSFLGVKVYYFNHSMVILALFLAILSLNIFLKRAWCRILCPLGALYAALAKFAVFKRVVSGCVDCKKCIPACRMGAIKRDISYEKGECILCMDCVYACPPRITRFMPVFSQNRKNPIKKDDSGPSLSRKNFIFLLGSALFVLPGFKIKLFSYNNSLIRPPLALEEEKFVKRCIRCGNCMKVCITNGLQPVLFQSGIEGIWTPHLVPEIGYCEYLCTLCGSVCPTGAIPKISIEQKKAARLGLAEINTSICIPWAQKNECIVCEEHCPIPQKAIKLEEESVHGKIIKKPYVDKALCVGCGICQNKCPTRPKRAIKVYPDLSRYKYV